MKPLVFPLEMLKKDVRKIKAVSSNAFEHCELEISAYSFKTLANQFKVLENSLISCLLALSFY